MNASDKFVFWGGLLLAGILMVIRVRQIIQERRNARRARDAIRDRKSEPPTPYVSEGPLFLDEWSDTPVHDAIALERLRDDIARWEA